MNYRKRHRLQHKVELSTLLKIAIVKKKKEHAILAHNTERSLENQLATEVIELAEMCDTALIVKNKKKRTVLEVTKAVY